MDPLLLLQQVLVEEAEEWTRERQGKGEKVPLEVRALHTWTEAGSAETRNVDPDGTQARASGGRKEGGSEYDRTRNGSKDFLEAILEEEDLVFGECRGEREEE